MMDQLWEHVRPADFLDIALVSIFIYGVFVWLRQRASRALGQIAGLLIAVFLLARWLDLYLTTMVFHFGAVGILLALVLVFQHDIRLGFERLSSSRWFRRPQADDAALTPSVTITETVVQMSQQRMGALIVFPGTQPLDRHLRGGITVDAEISQPLLMSIFHAGSPGHDGAVLIDGNRITQLGLYLPLTAQVSKVTRGGTRHAAALGLAECCDATVVVVSEERGTISIAHQGELQVVGPEELPERLQDCLGGASGTTQVPLQSRLVDMGTKLAAVVCAVTLWFSFAYQTDTIQRTFVVPIEYRNLPEGWEILDPKPTHAEITLSGTEPTFSMLDPAAFALSLEIGRGEFGDGQQSIVVWETEPNLKNVPKELTLEDIVPRTVRVNIRRKTGGNVNEETGGVPVPGALMFIAINGFFGRRPISS